MNFLPLSIILFLALRFSQLFCIEFNETLLTSGALTYAQLRQGCGISAFSQPRIVGGKDAKAGEWPWMAQLIVEYTNGEIQYCGGSLINNQCILTAAHCLLDYNQITKILYTPEKITVKLGHLDDNSRHNANGKTYITRQWETHKNYNWRKSMQPNDIALIKLKEPVIFTKWILPICLPEPCDPINSNYVGRTATVIGWGCITFEGNSHPRLQKVDIEVISYSTCKKDYRNLTNNQICAGDEKGEKDACRGDSGGPLMVTDSNDQFNVIGIVSYGKNTTASKLPGVYTKVSRYLTWIKKRCGMMDQY